MSYSPDVSVTQVLKALTDGIQTLLGNNLVGIYLTGSVSYEDFHPERSDIDLVVVTNDSLTSKQLKTLKHMHHQVEENHTRWATRIECSYVPQAMLSNIDPPMTPRPYIGEGIFYERAPYGNEWIIIQYLLHARGIALMGPAFNTLIKPIEMKDVQEACRRDLFQEWEPKIRDLGWLSNSHYQSYIILNLCRILYTIMRGAVASKDISARWVKGEYAPEWSPLIERAEKWQYGEQMNAQKKTIEFIRYVVEKVEE